MKEILLRKMLGFTITKVGAVQMFLSGLQYSELDAILKEFEVGLRSFVSERIIQKYSDSSDFESIIQQLKGKFDSTAIGVKPLLFQKYFSKIVYLENEGRLKNLYSALVFTYNCYLKQEHFEDNKVPNLSGILDLMFLLNDPLFKDFTNKFGLEFEDFLGLYLRIRNSSSHPGSNRISIEEARQITHFVLISTSILDIRYFWYVDVDEIKSKISKFTSSLDNKVILKHNLYRIRQNHEQLLLRETELSDLEKFLITNKRTSSSVVLHGYGGVGKTSLALEFCNRLVQRIVDSQVSYDFIVWASSKTEELGYNNRSGHISIKEYKPQYQSFNELINLICEVIGIDNYSTAELTHYFDMCGRGLIVIDNYENIQGEERILFEDFVSNHCPHNIQFIITSRQDEEIADKSIEIKGFMDVEIGVKFVWEYCVINGYSEKFNERELNEFISLSCGNTLVMTLMLDRIFEGIMDMKASIESLRPLRNREMEEIAEFMYKHMFDSILNENEKTFPHVRKILNVILLYKEAIDLHSLYDLTLIEMNELETVLTIFARKYIVNKVKGLYELNEMAIKFVSLKLIPDTVQIKELTEKIHSYRIDKKQSIERLSIHIEKNSRLKEIIEHWQPNLNSETIIIAQAFNLYKDCATELHKINRNDLVGKKALLSRIENEFEKLSERSGHPYVSFQKARVLSLLLPGSYQDVQFRKYLIDTIRSSYEEAYGIIYTGDHRNITNTRSFPAFLMFFGIFSLVDDKNPVEAVKYLEMASDLFHNRNESEEENCANTSYYLSQACCEVFRTSKKDIYLNKALKAINTASKYFRAKSDEKSLTKLKDLGFLSLFAQWMNGSITRKSIINSMKEYNNLQKHLKPFVSLINEKLDQRRTDFQNT